MAGNRGCRLASDCTALHCTALHCTALHCTALHSTALHCTALRPAGQSFRAAPKAAGLPRHHGGSTRAASLHCTALHCTALHCTALPGPLVTTVQCSGLIYIVSPDLSRNEILYSGRYLLTRHRLESPQAARVHIACLLFGWSRFTDHGGLLFSRWDGPD
jgi:hypothetical protein